MPDDADLILATCREIAAELRAVAADVERAVPRLLLGSAIRHLDGHQWFDVIARDLAGRGFAKAATKRVIAGMLERLREASG